jgi:excinuclease ABC subunit A
LQEIAQRLRFLVDVGLDYLTLERSAETLSGGEAQRIRLASQIGAGLVGVMYILDEPSIGLHQRDNERLLGTLTRLRDLGNTVIVVEHDEDAIRAADHVVDLGPGAGVHGGELVAAGHRGRHRRRPGLADRPLSGRRAAHRDPSQAPVRCRGQAPAHPRRNRQQPARHRRGHPGRHLLLRHRRLRLRQVDADQRHPLSGRGAPTQQRQPAPWPHRAIEGLEHFDKVVDIDQSPIGRTPRSNPATYTGLFNLIRDLFANVPEARSRGYGPGASASTSRAGAARPARATG